MSLVERTANISPRLIATGLLIAFVSTFVMASKWDSLTTFALNFDANKQTGQSKNNLLDQSYKSGAFLTPGTCDTAGPIEVEGSIIGTTPTAYATLGDAFTAINAGTHTGAITIDVCGDSTELATAVLNASGTGSASYTTITMSPAGGAARTITGSLAAPLIDFNGADSVTINGLNTGGNSLTISNTNAGTTSGTSTFRFIGDATGNTITNANILGSATMTSGTNGGTIFFSTAASGGTGNDNNTISNSNIGPATATLPTKAVYGNGTTTAVGNYNSGIIITGNNIFDFFLPTGQSNGILLSGGNTDWTISNNKFYQTATRTQTTAAIHAPIQLASSNVNNCTISGNTIGFSSNTGTGTYSFAGIGSASRFYPIYISTHGSTTATNITNNIISAISVSGAVSGTSTNAPFAGILYASPSSATWIAPNITGNTIGSTTVSGAISFTSSSISASDVYGIYFFPSANNNISSNNVGGITATNSTTGGIDFYGIRAFTTSTATNTFQNNTVGYAAAPIANNATASTSNTIGIYSQSGASVVTGNTISNLTMVAGNASTGAGASIIGLWSDNTSATIGNNISQNTVRFLSNTDAANNDSVQGILYNASSTGTHTIQRNLVHSLSVPNSPTGTVNGIFVQAGSATFRNNMIALGNGLTNGEAISGFNEIAGTNNFYHNSVYIGGSGVSGTANTFGFQSAVTTNTRNYRDNIFFNARSNGAGTGKHYAIGIGSLATNLTSNNNILYVTGTGGFVGRFNSIDQTTLADWQTATGQDANSFSANPQYNDPTNTTPDLHLNPAVSTVAEGNGADVGVTDDFDGQTRAGLTPVDIGADAGNFMGIDLSPPSIGYSPLANTSSTVDRVLTTTISDTTGVATGGLAPRIYYRKNAGTYFSSGCLLTGGTVNNGTWDCTINNADMGGVAATDVINYFVIAQDTLGNIGSNPAGAVASDVNTVTTPPASPNTYTVVATYSGSFNVGTGETYTSLTNAGGIFEALNNGAVVGNVTINITSDLTAETGTVGLNQMLEEGGGAGTYTITIRPGGGAARLVSGTATGGLIRLNGADRVTIDGLNTGGDSLTIRNLSTTSTANSGATISFATDSSNNTIQNLTIEGAHTSSTSGVVFIGGGTVSSVTGNDNNLITNNVIRDRSDAAGIPTVLIYSAGVSATVLNSNNTISGNTLKNFTGTAIATTQPATENWTISGNTIFEETQRTTALFGINFAASGTNTITQNTIRDLNTSSTVTGIQLNDSRNTTVSRNHIHSIPSTSGSTSVLHGILFSGSSGNPASVTIVNNMVSIIPAFTNAQTINGIRDFAFAGNTFTADHNTILIGGTASGSSSSWALVRGTAAPTNYTARNNIAFNNRLGGTGSHFAVGDQSANTGTFVSDYNIFVGTGATAANFFDYGTSSAGTPVSFAAWQTGPPVRDANSQASNPGGNYTVANMFVSDTDLHLNTAGTNPALNAGTTLGSVTSDFDGDTRPQETAVEIGADEIVPAIPGTLQLSSATYSQSETGPTATITVTRTGGTDGAVSVNYATVAGGTATGGGSCGAGVDYVNAGGTLNWANGDGASKTFNVTICDDNLYESPNETVNLALSSPTGGATLGSPNTAVLTITENDTQPSVQFSGISGSVSESFGTVFIPITRSGALGNAITVNAATVAGGTATAGACAPGVDYNSNSIIVSWAANDSAAKFIPVTICNDNVYELNQTINLALSSPTGGAVLGTPNTFTETINNDDAAPTVTINDISLAEGNSGTTNFQTTFTITGANEVSGGFNFQTADNTATAPSDYTAITPTAAVIPANVNRTTATLNGSIVLVNGDTMFEPNETFFLNGSSCTDCSFTDNQGVATIQNDDTQPTLQFSSATYTSSDDISQNTGQADEFVPQVTTITVTRTGSTGDAVSVNYATVAGGSATGGASCGTGSGVDYVNASGTLNFAAGDTSKTFNITVCTDNRFEGDETVNLALSSPTAPAILGTPNTAVLTITDNDTQPSLQFSSATYSVGEGGGSATITVTRTGAVDNTVSVSYSTVAGGTALGGGACGPPVDYVNTSGTLNFGAGVISQTFNVPICEDALIEGSETVNLALSSPGGGAVLGSPNTAVLTITDNDSDTTAPTVTYTPLSNVATVQDRVFTVTATDNVGVTAVTVVWRNNDGGVGNFLTNPCSFAGGTAQNGTWTCTIVSGIGTQTNPGTVDYFVSADDAAANSATRPAGATVNGGTWNLYTIGSGGTINVGTINSFENLFVGSGFTFNGNATVTGNLTLSGGILNTGGFTLTLECNATVTGGGETNYIIGNLEKRFCNAITFTYPVGAAFALPPVTGESTLADPEGIASNYSPLTVTITGGTVGSSLTVSATDAFMDGAVQVNSISRFWTLTENGNLTADLTFTYRNEDVVGTETSYNVLRRAGGMTANYPGGTVNGAANTFTAPNVSDFSQWSAGVAVPTAANAEISGQLTTSGGEGIRNATVMLTGGTLTEPVYVRTGTFGNYKFSNLPVGQIYVVTVISKRYTFANPSRVINLTDSVTDENFVAQEQ